MATKATKKSTIKDKKSTKATKPAKQPKLIQNLRDLAEAKTEGLSKTNYYKVKPHLVTFEKGFNIRDKTPELEAHIERLYQHMKAGGQVPAIDVVVSDNKIVARDGHSRTEAAKRLWDEGVEIYLDARQVRGNDQDQIVHMLTSDQGKKFSQLEQGRGFLKLLKLGLSNTEIADKLGVHKTTVANGLALAEAPTNVQKLLAEGKVSNNVVLRAIKDHGSKAGEVITEKVEGAGGKKVTPKRSEGASIKPAVAKQLYSIAENIRITIKKKDFNFLTNTPDVELQGHKIEVDALALKELLQAFTEGYKAEVKADLEGQEEVPEPKKKKDKKEKKAKKGKKKKPVEQIDPEETDEDDVDDHPGISHAIPDESEIPDQEDSDSRAGTSDESEHDIDKVQEYLTGRKVITIKALAKGMKLSEIDAEDYLEQLVGLELAKAPKKAGGPYTILIDADE